MKNPQPILALIPHAVLCAFDLLPQLLSMILGDGGQQFRVDTQETRRPGGRGHQAECTERTVKPFGLGRLYVLVQIHAAALPLYAALQASSKESQTTEGVPTMRWTTDRLTNACPASKPRAYGLRWDASG
ncbi:hypothetical protein [Nonomuraea sp. NPDC049480]|uniref:hypothetical protein n=1 Tax=Nonomuraea sp. NPDC049480 TaxID=3364353 RepID=UPI0037B5E183